jgi:hypothetical protein
MFLQIWSTARKGSEELQRAHNEVCVDYVWEATLTVHMFGLDDGEAI